MPERASRSASVFSMTSRAPSAHPPWPRWRSARRCPLRRPRPDHFDAGCWLTAFDGQDLLGRRSSALQMPFHLRSRLQRRGLPRGDLGHPFRREVHVGKGGGAVTDLLVTGDLTSPQLHDRDTLEHRASSLRLRQQRAIAEGVACIDQLAVRHGGVHVPPKIRGGAIEPVVDHLGYFGPAFERTVEQVVIDAVFGKQLGEISSIASFDGLAKCAEQRWYIHLLSPDCPTSATAAIIRAMSCGRDRR